MLHIFSEKGPRWLWLVKVNMVNWQSCISPRRRFHITEVTNRNKRKMKKLWDLFLEFMPWRSMGFRGLEIMPKSSLLVHSFLHQGRNSSLANLSGYKKTQRGNGKGEEKPSKCIINVKEHLANTYYVPSWVSLMLRELTILLGVQNLCK